MRTLKSSDWGEGAATCVAGIAPLLQLICCITRTRTSLIFANQVSSESAVRAGMSHCWLSGASACPQPPNRRAPAGRAPRLWRGSLGMSKVAGEAEARPGFPLFLFFKLFP